MGIAAAIWILIAHNSDYKSASSVVAEFNSESSCIAALEVMRDYQQEHLDRDAFAFCVEK